MTTQHRMRFTTDGISMRGVHLRILAAGYPQEEQVLFWMWNDLLPHRLHRVCVLLWRLPVQQHLSALGLAQALDAHFFSGEHC